MAIKKKPSNNIDNNIDNKKEIIKTTKKKVKRTNVP